MKPAAARLLGLSALAAAVALTGSACVIDLGDDDTTCAGAIALTLVVDPSTLVCRELPFTCGCGDCPPGDPSDPQPTWAPCQTSCTGLSSNECAATPGCRTAWDHACLVTDAICTLPDPYFGCFGVDATGPVQGACEGLDAVECSRHDDCLATYQRDARCGNQIDDDADGIVDEPDECLTFTLCMNEQR